MSKKNWWEDSKDDYSPEQYVYYEILGGYPIIINYFSGFEVKKPDWEGGTLFKRIKLVDFLWKAHKDGYVVGEGWGMNVN